MTAKKSLKTLRLTLKSADSPDGEDAIYWDAFYEDHRLGTLFVKSPKDGPLFGPCLKNAIWDNGSIEGLKPRRMGSLLKEAAVVVLEQALDASKWERRVRLTLPENPNSTWHVDPERIGFQRAWHAETPDMWEFRPERDAFGHFDGSTGDGNIVAALSGGGLRAAGFALGVFSVLNEIGALDHLTAVASVSGGSLFTGAWLAARARNPDASFESFSTSMEAFIQGRGGVDATQQTDHPKLIRRFADLCAPGLFGDGEGSPLRLKDLPNAPEVVFQCTELTQGGSFTFTVTPNENVHQGAGKRLRFRGEIVNEVRLADAVAASAAFPVGFEPFVFPNDFDLDEAAKAAETTIDTAQARGSWPSRGRAGVPLVDGGVFDNQGIHPARNAIRRNDGAELLIVVDADQGDPNTALFETSDPAISNAVGRVIVLILCIVLGMLSPIAGWVLAAVATATLLVGLTRQVKHQRSSLPKDLAVWDQLWPTRLVKAVHIRLRVAVLLLTDVFMRRVRGLSYGDIYARRVDPHVTPATLHIRDLLKLKEAGDDTLRASLLAMYPVSEQIFAAVKTAAEMPTTLRLPGDYKHREDATRDLVRAGRATAILKLLYTLHRVPRPRNQKAQGWIGKLEGLWEKEVAPADGVGEGETEQTRLLTQDASG